jgi:hypothetical protein
MAHLEARTEAGNKAMWAQEEDFKTRAREQAAASGDPFAMSSERTKESLADLHTQSSEMQVNASLLKARMEMSSVIHDMFEHFDSYQVLSIQRNSRQHAIFATRSKRGICGVKA